MKSGSAHCDLELAVEVRQYPLRSGARCWEEEDEEEEQVTLIKSRDPHLAGGEDNFPILGGTNQLGKELTSKCEIPLGRRARVGLYSFSQLPGHRHSRQEADTPSPFQCCRATSQGCT